MAYDIVLKPSAKRGLDALPKSAQARIIQALESRAENPSRHGVIKLESEADLYRIRVGSHRVVYTIEDNRLVVLVLKVGHRREVYR
jgi:mRNA interferase RelE/StbE